jgi:cysteine synthase
MSEDSKIADSVLDLVRGTPMIRLNRVVQAGWAEVVAKLGPTTRLAALRTASP